MSRIHNQGRVAGFWYLMVIIFGIFAELVRSSLVIPGQGAVTVANLQGSELLFRVGFVSDLVMMVSFLFLGFAFFRLLQKIDHLLAASIVIFVVLGVAINLTGLGSYYSVLNWLSAADASTAQVQTLAAVALYRNTYAIANLFFGLWLIPTGLLIFRSGLVPRSLGVVATVAGAFFIADSLFQFLFPAFLGITSILTAVPMILGEFGICFWLLFAGSRTTTSPDTTS